MKEYKAVFFDFDDTLGYRDHYAYECFRNILLSNVQIDDPWLLESIMQDFMLADENGNCSKKNVTDMLERDYGIILPYEDYGAYWDSRLWEFSEPMEGASEVLSVLSGKYKLGIITNGPSDGQRKKLETAGLKQFFPDEHIIVSGDYDFKKPDVRMFEAAAEKLGVSCAESVMVGDIFGRDIIGAHRAGMRPIWIWRDPGRKCYLDVERISSLRQLPEIL